MKLRRSLAISILRLYNSEEYQILITEASCKVFDNDYVLNTIVTPLIKNMPLIEKLQRDILSSVGEQMLPRKKPLTKPVSPKITKTVKKRVKDPLPVEPVEYKSTFKEIVIPTTTYREERNIKKKLQQAREVNRDAAIQLLQLANEKCFRVAGINKIVQPPPKPPKVTIKAKKVPKFKEIEIKHTAATQLRQASVYAKEQEKEIKELELLMSGTFDDTTFEKWEEQERQRKEQENIQEIERKHLQGVLTYEESILAKQNLIDSNKEKFCEFMEEKHLLYEKLDLWKKQEQEKARFLVEKTQIGERNARDAERRVIEEKYFSARQFDNENKKLLEEAMQRKQEELNRKIELIKELKALQAIKSHYVKEFDPTETANLGLECEMSIAELQERLSLLKLELKQELEEKRKTIVDKKKERKELLQNAQELVQYSKSLKVNTHMEKKSKKCPVQLKETPEIAALKDKISEVRKLRMKDFK